jgi:signal transduction histidine kinase
MTPHKNARIAFASAVAILLVSAIAAYGTILRLDESAHWVVHTYQVESALGELDASVSRLARARSAYALTGNPDLVESFERGIPDVQQKIQEIRDLTADSPSQIDLCDRLADAIQHRISLSKDSIALKNSSPHDEAGQSRITTETLNLAFQSAEIVQRMRQREQSLLEVRTKESNRLYALTVIILAATFTLALILFFIHYRLLHTELRAREAAEKAALQGEDSLRHLTSRLLQMQDEERRKFSRELHDSLGQYLAGAKMNLDMLSRTNPKEELLTSAIELLDQSISETRTISHLLHPPLLDEVGFASAANWYVQGFSERSGVEVNVDIPKALSRLPRPLELGLFRVLQESLTNIHRHSKSSRAEVSLKYESDTIVLRVKDYGKGMALDSLRSFQTKGTNLGVGLTGMRERVRELSGNLDIQSGPSGTLIVITLPLNTSRSQSPNNADD